MMRRGRASVQDESPAAERRRPLRRGRSRAPGAVERPSPPTTPLIPRGETAGFARAPFGIVGLETAVALCSTASTVPSHFAEAIRQDVVGPAAEILGFRARCRWLRGGRGSDPPRPRPAVTVDASKLPPWPQHALQRLVPARRPVMTIVGGRIAIRIPC
jgi:hypothetical protein